MSISGFLKLSLAVALGFIIALSIHNMLGSRTTPVYAEGLAVNQTTPPKPVIQPPKIQEVPPEPKPCSECIHCNHEPRGHAAPVGVKPEFNVGFRSRFALKLLWVAYADYNGLKTILEYSSSKQAQELADAAWSFYLKAREYYDEHNYELSITYARLSIQASNLAINYIALQSNTNPPS